LYLCFYNKIVIVVIFLSISFIFLCFEFIVTIILCPNTETRQIEIFYWQLVKCKCSDRILQNKAQRRIFKTNFSIPSAGVRIQADLKAKNCWSISSENKIDVKWIERKSELHIDFSSRRKKHAFILNDVVMCIKISDRAATTAWRQI
jgi:hypothetical protein